MTWLWHDDMSILWISLEPQGDPWSLPQGTCASHPGPRLLAPGSAQTKLSKTCHEIFTNYIGEFCIEFLWIVPYCSYAIPFAASEAPAQIHRRANLRRWHTDQTGRLRGNSQYPSFLTAPYPQLSTEINILHSSCHIHLPTYSCQTYCQTYCHMINHYKSFIYKFRCAIFH